MADHGVVELAEFRVGAAAPFGGARRRVGEHPLINEGLEFGKPDGQNLTHLISPNQSW